jgi:hypothetical protein
MTKDERIAMLEDRVEELERLLGIDPAQTDEYRCLGISPTMRVLLGLLMKRESLCHEVAYAALYGNRPESRQPADKIISSFIFRLRNELHRLAVEIRTSNLAGWRIAPDDKQRLRVIVDRLNARGDRLANCGTYASPTPGKIRR